MMVLSELSATSVLGPSVLCNTGERLHESQVTLSLHNRSFTCQYSGTLLAVCERRGPLPVAT